MSVKEKDFKELSADEVMQKFDKESDKREVKGIWNIIINAICICTDPQKLDLKI